MLDGLDEVADPEGRQAVSEWVDQQIKKYPRCRFVITSRPRGYDDAPLKQANVVEVQLFNAGQITRFIKGWYLESETVRNGHVVDRGVKLRASREAEDLMKRLLAPKAQAINALTANPLLLTMIAMVHCFRGQLPGSRVELYREICEVLLGRWRQMAGMQERMTTDQKRDVLMPLAAWMTEQKTTEITTDEAKQIIEQPLSQVGMQGAEAELFLSDLHDCSGLVLEREASSWSFAHKTFQEYLTATYWLTENIPPNWAALVKHDWWYETLRLYAMQGDATPILQACLNEGSVPALTLAAEIIEEGPRKTDQTVRADVYRRVDGALEAPDPELRRLAAQVKLSQRLKNLYLLDHQNGVAIDLEYVTCAEYQLFLDDTLGRGTYHQPDHWIDASFPSGQGDKPVCGMQAEDAEAFCDWLTRRQGGNARYCLPSLDEAQAAQPAKETHFLATWCRDSNGFCLTPLDEAKEQENRQKLLSFSATKLPFPSQLSSINAIVNANDLTFAFARGHELALDRARANQGDRALARAFAGGSHLAVSRARDLVSRARDIDRARNLDRSQDLACVLDLARALTDFIALALSRDRDRSIGRGLVGFIDRVLGRDCEGPLDRDFARAIGRNRDLGIVMTRDLTNVTDHAFDIARDLTRNLDQAFDLDRTLDRTLDLASTLNLANARAQSLASGLSLHIYSAIFISWSALLANLLVDELTLITAGTASMARQAQRQYVARFTEYIYSIVVESMDSPWWRRWRRARRVVESRDADRRALLEYYWWLQIVMAREAGALPAWEGIRIVQKPMESIPEGT